MKDHFVKLAVTLIGRDKSILLIRDICIQNKFSIKKMRQYEKEILSCEFIVTKNVDTFEQLKEMTYG